MKQETAVQFKYIRLAYRTPMSGELAALRLLSLPILCWFGATFGRVAASVVWDAIYGVGSRVISDAIYYNLQDDVRWWGGIAGLCLAVAINCLPQLWPFAAFPATYVLSILAGVVGGHFGWKYGLFGYFGVHAVITMGCVLLAGFEIRERIRFSLRTLLIAMTLVAVVLGLVVIAL
jgi:hypothetical protein